MEKVRLSYAVPSHVQRTFRTTCESQGIVENVVISGLMDALSSGIVIWSGGKVVCAQNPIQTPTQSFGSPSFISTPVTSSKKAKEEKPAAPKKEPRLSQDRFGRTWYEIPDDIKKEIDDYDDREWYNHFRADGTYYRCTRFINEDGSHTYINDKENLGLVGNDPEDK